MWEGRGALAVRRQPNRPCCSTCARRLPPPSPQVSELLSLALKQDEEAAGEKGKGAGTARQQAKQQAAAAASEQQQQQQ